MSQFPYRALDNFVLRTPSKSLSSLKNLLRKEDVLNDELKQFCSDPHFQEALFLASPNLYEVLIDYLKTEKLTSKKRDKLKLSLLKYISRMSSRSTPFGLFSGYTIGTFNHNTDLELNDISMFSRFTRLDMQYLVALSKNFTKDKSIRKTLLFTPNTSLYKIGNQYRYIEITYLENLKRVHHIEAVESDKYLEFIFKVTKKESKSIDFIANGLINFDPEITIEEAYLYINLLVDNQILVSNIDPVIIGKDYLEIIRDSISSKNELKTLNLLNKLIQNLDEEVINPVQKYYNIKTVAEKLKTEIDLKYFFQTDLKVNLKSNFLERKILKDLKEGIIFLNKLSIISKNTSESYLDLFKTNFKKRYEDQEIPLAKALDPESGIGYKHSDMSEIIPDNNFIDHLIIPKSGNNKNEIPWNNVNAIFHYKISQAYKNNDYIIKLYPDDLPEWIDETWDDLPDTLSLMTEIVCNDGIKKIKILGTGGSSAANLFGRFCLCDRQLTAHVNSIIDIEKKINSNVILADISHLPESRIGNVICRPAFNKYEIPYLANSVKPQDYQISIDDIMISIVNNKIILRSKKLNKIILPRLTNAHNFSANSLPIYQFLCDLQLQGKRSGLGFSLGSMAKNYKFIPRIELNNVILNPAVWNLRKKDLEIFTENSNIDFDLLNAARITRNKWKMPKYILLTENDNELLIDLENRDSIKMMVDAIGEKENFIFKEFLFTDDKQILRNANEYHTNQIVITFYNNQKLSNINNG